MGGGGGYPSLRSKVPSEESGYTSVVPGEGLSLPSPTHDREYPSPPRQESECCCAAGGRRLSRSRSGTFLFCNVISENGDEVHVAMHENDLIYSALLANEQLSDGAYDWLKVLKYYIEIKNVLQATTEDCISTRIEQTGSEEENTQSKTSLQQIGKCMSGVQ